MRVILACKVEIKFQLAVNTFAKLNYERKIHRALFTFNEKVTGSQHKENV